MQVKGGCAAKMHFAVDAYLEEMKPWTTLCLGLSWGALGVSDLLGMLSLFGATCD